VGSFSKLNTVSDVSPCCSRLFLILKSYKPLTFFGIISIVLLMLGLGAGARPCTNTSCIASFRRAQCGAGRGADAAGVFHPWTRLILNSTNLRLLELERLVCKKLAQRTTGRRE